MTRGRSIAVVLTSLTAAGLVLTLLITHRYEAASFLDWIHRTGPAGAVLYTLVYVGATLLVLPGSVLTLGAGFAYGVLLGTALAWVASMLVAVLAFQLGRGVARRFVERRAASNRRFAAIDAAIGSRGFRIVLLLRMSPVVPFSLLNYGLGLTSVRLRDYVLASWIGMLPGTIFYVYLGSAAGSGAALLAGRHRHVGPWEHVLFWAGLAVTAVLTVLIVRISRRALAGMLDGHTQPSPHSGPPGGKGEAA